VLQGFFFPPFYRTWWFVAIDLMGVLVAVVLTWRSRVSQMKQAHAVQQAFTRQLIASQECERKRIPQSFTMVWGNSWWWRIKPEARCSRP
jgi:hypothetical protein